MRQIGVIIQQGPQPWSIIQQEQGAGQLSLKGIWQAPEDTTVDHAQVWARIVHEQDAQVIIDWQAARMEAEGNWEITIGNIPVGGLYRLETCLQLNHNPASEWNVRGDMIHHIGIGDLWVIAGQSNAAGYGKGPIQDAPQLGVHLLRNNGQWDLASHPFNESTASIHFANREYANPGHSPFLAFGKMLQKEAGIPVGLIQTALGGSPLRAWNPDEDGVLYRNAMQIIQAAGGKIRGVVWYQGCSDCNPEESATYLARFVQMVQHWRKDCNDPLLPILTVQLNRLTEASSLESDQSWGRVREAQRQAAHTIPGVHIVPALDCPLSDPIHNSPAGNLMIGERMGKTALAHVYGKKSVPAGAPDLIAAKLQQEGTGSGIVLTFANVYGYLIAIGPADAVFAAEDDTGEIGVDTWTITSRNEIRLSLSRAPVGELYVHGASTMNPALHLPVDTGTYMPMLAFYRQQVSL